MALATQMMLGESIPQRSVLFAVYLFIVITLIALVVDRIWSAQLSRIVALVVAPILVITGLRFLGVGLFLIDIL